jgi:chromosome segregation ATPase
VPATPAQPGVALAVVTTAALAAAGESFTPKKGKKASSKSTGRTPRTKSLEKKIKAKGTELGRHRENMAAIDQDIKVAEKEIAETTAKVERASGDEKVALEKALEDKKIELEATKKKRTALAPRTQMYEIIATAADALERRTKMNTKIRKENDIRKKLKDVADAATEAVKKAIQTMRNERDPELKAVAAAQIKTAEANVPPKEQEVTQQSARVNRLKEQSEDLKAAVAAMVDATSGVIPLVDANDIDEDMLQVGLAAQATFNEFCEEFDRRPAVL